MSSLAGAVAVVTGASKGIGAAIAKKLATEGAAVALIGRDLTRLDQVRTSLPTSVKSVSVSCDLLSSEQIKMAVSKVADALGDPTILVNNAGMTGPFHWIDEVSDDEWETIFFTNVRAPFILAKRLLPLMKKAGHGRIINIASVQAQVGVPRSSTFVASKAALVGFTKAIAAEWGRWGITCNTVSPSYTATGLNPASIETHRHFVRSRIPAGRGLALPEEIANYVAFLSFSPSRSPEWYGCSRGWRIVGRSWLSSGRRVTFMKQCPHVETVASCAVSGPFCSLPMCCRPLPTGLSLAKFLNKLSKSNPVSPLVPPRPWPKRSRPA